MIAKVPKQLLRRVSLKRVCLLLCHHLALGLTAVFSSSMVTLSFTHYGKTQEGISGTLYAAIEVRWSLFHSVNAYHRHPPAP